MENARLFALSILVSYFLVIICLFGVILNSFRGLVGAASKSKVLAFSTLTVASFAHTWFCTCFFHLNRRKKSLKDPLPDMFKFMHVSD